MRHYFLLFFIILSFGLFGQTGSVKGIVLDKVSRAPMMFTNVFLQGFAIGATTDENGFYFISKIPPGDYTLMVTAVGYDTIKIPVNVTANITITKNIELKEAVYQLTTFTINADRQEGRTDTKISIVKVTPKQINQIPTIGGQADIAQYLQVIPGVVFTGDQGGQLYIRGGTPIQNLVLLDGMTIYNPFHSIGLFSVFDADLISVADVYTGGFGAEYGDRISSVMDISYKYGNTRRLSGKFDVNSFGTKLILEGPLVKQTSPDKGSISMVVSAKNSYIKESSTLLYPYVNNGDGIPFSFSDYYGKISFNGSNGNRLDVFGFNFNDQVTYKTINNYQWISYGGGMKFNIVPSNSPMLIEGKVAYSNYKLNLEDGTGLDRFSNIGGFNMGLDFTYFAGKNRVKYGIDIKGFTTDYTYVNSLERTIKQKESTTEIAAYFTTKLNYGKIKDKNAASQNTISYSRLIIEPGLRVQYYASLANISFEPRLSMKYSLSNNLRIKAAAGIFSQNLISTSSDRDVVNLFYGFISGPENLQTNFNGKELTHKLQKSNHIIGGIEYDLGNRITLNLEAYFKYFSQLTNINRNKVFDDSPEYIDKPDALKKDFIIETGDAQGVDFSLKYEYHELYIWFVYSMGFNHRFDGLMEYIPHFDRRHNINFLTTYSFGKTKLWEISGRWNFGSGFPFTPTIGNYEILTFSDGINTDYTVANGEIGIVYGDINSHRLPSYHRMDIAIKRKFLITETSSLEVNIGATNIYNRNNIFYIDRITNERVDQLPFLPSIGLNFVF
ncbi:MAG: TonB-dependent receptor [Bacteroidales bacterium]|nr:TonB-dependent receptor [Bacteroidales bacterium]